MISRIMQPMLPLSDESLVQRCLDEMGGISIDDETRLILEEFAAKNRAIEDDTAVSVSQVLQMIATTHEFQRA